MVKVLHLAGRGLGVLLALASVGVSHAEEDERASEPGPEVHTLTASELLVEGGRAFDAGNVARAEALFEGFLVDFGEEEGFEDRVALVRPLLALSKVRLRKFGEARPLIADCLGQKLEPKTAEALRFWSGVCALQAGDYAEAQHAFGRFFKNESHGATRRREALLLFGTADVMQGNFSKAAAFFEKQLPKVRAEAPDAGGRCAVLLLHSLTEGGRQDDAVALIKREYPRMGEMSQLVSFQSLAMKLGAHCLEGGDYYGAIACLQRIWPQGRLLRHQSNRIASLKERLAAVRLRGGCDALVYQTEGVLTRLKREVEHFAAIENFDTTVRLRLAQAFQGQKRFREAALVLEKAVVQMPEESELGEPVRLQLLQCWMETGAWDRALAVADAWLQTYGGTSPESAQVRFLRGEILRSAGRYDEALRAFRMVMDGDGKSEFAPQALFLIGICHLNKDENESAGRTLRKLQSDFAKSPLVDDAYYWEGMALSFSGKFTAAREHLVGYAKRFPKGKYLADAAFRQAFCYHSEAWYREGIAGFQRFLKTYGDSSYGNEARILLGDAFLATARIEEGIEILQTIPKDGGRFHEDAWFKVGKALRLTDQKEKMREHFSVFVRDNEESARVAEAVHWIGWAHAQEGQAEKGASVCWDAVSRLGDRPGAIGIEDILLGLPKVVSDRVVLLRRLDAEIAKARKSGQGVLEVRLLWARGKLSGKNGRAYFLDAGGKVDPSKHSARILADCADLRREEGYPKVAAKLYRELLRWHPRAVESGRAHYGLGVIAAADGQSQNALEHFRHFTEKAATSTRMGEVLLAKARLEIEIGMSRDARRTLDALLESKLIGSREKAQGLLLLGQLMQDTKQPRKATAYFERVYVAYGKHGDLVATAYLQRARALEEMEEPDLAAEVYRELVGRDELADFPEALVARERLEVIDG